MRDTGRGRDECAMRWCGGHGRIRGARRRGADTYLPLLQGPVGRERKGSGAGTSAAGQLGTIDTWACTHT